MIATFWPQHTPATKFWRCDVPARYMPAALADFDSDVFDGGADVMMARQEGGTAIWQFVARPQRRLAMAHMKLRGVRVLFECDDNYTLMPPDLPGKYKRGDFIREEPAWNDNRSSVEVAMAAASDADGVVCSTRFLAKRYQRTSNPYTFYCPNCVDLSDWPARGDHHDDGVFRVGFVGSASHYHDIPLIERALRWASKQDGVEVCVAGVEHPALDFPHRKIPPVPFEQYRQLYTLFDVVLCPIKPTEWSLARSDNKVIESALGGAACVVSPVDVFRDWLDAGTVVKAGTNKPKDFLGAVQYLVRHKDEARDMAAKTRDLVENDRTIQGNIWRWQEACEPRRRVKTRRKLMGWVNHNDMVVPFVKALEKDGWTNGIRMNHADVTFMDYPIQGWGQRWMFADQTASNGGVVIETPHGGIPMLTYDGGVETHPAVEHALVPAEGWADLYRTFGCKFESHVVGWSLCGVLPYKKLGKVENVLFAPAHPNTGGEQTILPWLQRANEIGYQRLIEHGGSKLVRFWGMPELNGMPEEPDPDVQYVHSDMRVASAVEMIDWADLVISYGTLACLSLARGKPTVFLEDPRPILDDGTLVSRTYDEWRDGWEYPAKVGDWPSFDLLLKGYRHQEGSVIDWRNRWIGKPFDPARCAEIVNEIAYGKPVAVEELELVAA